jgi:hypothetical protein
MIAKSLSLLLLASVSANAAVITTVGLEAFITPLQEDFNGLSTGSITETNSAFTNIGISSISISPGTVGDEFNTGGGGTNVLWGDATGLLVAQLNDGLPGRTLLRDTNYTINFTSPTARVGVVFVDIFSDLPSFEFFDGATSLGSIVASAGNQVPMYFESDVAFDRVEIISAAGDGFGLDMIIVDSVVPEPSATSSIIGLSVLAFTVRRRRRSH